MEQEIWKDIGVHKGIDFTGLYEVSSLGRVKSLQRRLRWGYYDRIKILSGYRDKDGYINYDLYNILGRHKRKAHRLAGDCFIKSDKNTDLLEINHINGIRDDNRINNLEWCTHSENCIHRSTLLNNLKSNE